MSYLPGDRIVVATQSYKGERQYIGMHGTVLKCTSGLTLRKGKLAPAHDVIVRLDGMTRNLWFLDYDIQPEGWVDESNDEMRDLLAAWQTIRPDQNSELAIWPSGAMQVSTKENAYYIYPQSGSDTSAADLAFALQYLVLREHGEYRKDTLDATASGEERNS